jgi:hypothetical protein
MLDELFFINMTDMMVLLILRFINFVFMISNLMRNQNETQQRGGNKNEHREQEERGPLICRKCQNDVFTIERMYVGSYDVLKVD